ncbi:integrating conjugative element protein [Pseudomonas fluorescens HK44]|uniref:Integrating conjugative element protein n=1 Tax=Pseudomonas fluorescens HK44 TaxID=1042209 RepID=A0A010ST20_PSEFL|nr:integrating conjugative element protein [Pseudomonas fluorescens]EXF95910.1 integrating conjugative element protein [Pseudomonas fluorescens HK44]
MNRTALAAVIGLLSAASACAQTTTAPLIVVEDRGGVSALPYYEALNPQSGQTDTRPPASVPQPRVGNAVDAEASMLPVRSTMLSPGDVQPGVIHAPGLTPFFLIGDDEQSRTWLRQKYPALREVHAVGLVVNVASVDALQALRRLAPQLPLSPVSGDDLAQRLGIKHYPVLITATGIEQ